MATYSPGDIVVVPFPFSERNAVKRRPALVCSAAAFNDAAHHLVLAMITTAAHKPWPGDVAIRDLTATGLPVPSMVRWKLFTLDASLVVRRAGALSARDRATCRRRQPIAL
ncbi:MAG: type II toxin-antitoxin system PemK/MazF family toxin [Gemmatimonadaceae bacterium]|jgi:mRNA interferase MazF|nr:type II toxin-antitoxin system PemK/MazF family toxin [Gemmatimonadaceae bacterium]